VAPSVALPPSASNCVVSAITGDTVATGLDFFCIKYIAAGSVVIIVDAVPEAESAGMKILVAGVEAALTQELVAEIPDVAVEITCVGGMSTGGGTCKAPPPARRVLAVEVSVEFEITATTTDDANTLQDLIVSIIEDAIAPGGSFDANEALEVAEEALVTSGDISAEEAAEANITGEVISADVSSPGVATVSPTASPSSSPTVSPTATSSGAPTASPPLCPEPQAVPPWMSKCTSCVDLGLDELLPCSENGDTVCTVCDAEDEDYNPAAGAAGQLDGDGDGDGEEACVTQGSSWTAMMVGAVLGGIAMHLWLRFRAWGARKEDSKLEFQVRSPKEPRQRKLTPLNLFMS